MPSATSIPPIACEESSDESQEDKDLRISESSFQRQETALEQSHQQLPNAAKRLKRLMARLQVPAWFSLSSHAWEVCCYKAKSGWMFTAQAYRVVPDDSPIMKFARSGDVRGIQELFKKNMASPYDRRTGGETVLDVGAFNADLLSNSLLEPQANSGTNKRAAFYQHLEVCRLLLNEGADPSISSSRCVGESF
jgi:hypothetical protein